MTLASWFLCWSSTKKGRGILGCAANSFDLNSNFLKESIREALAK